MKKGFTLVELSIVLVIIGLLIGGILVGQSLIESSKITNFIKQIQQLDIATKNFKVKYKYLPGDSPVHSSTGDGDGWITDSVLSIANYNGEIGLFWPQLSKEMGGVTYTNPTSTLAVGTHMPKTSIGEKSGIMASRNITGIFPTSPKINFWSVASWSASTRDFAGNADVKESLSVPTTIALDAKMDDGVANTGSLRAIGQTNGQAGIAPGETARAACQSAGVYNTATTEATPCGVSIEMFAQIGENTYK